MPSILREACRHPRQTGAIAASGRRLCQTMAATACQGDPQVIIEVGAGTGAITEALLCARKPGTRLIVCERNPEFRSCLTRVIGDAAHVDLFIGEAIRLPLYLQEQGVAADVVVSGLPFASLGASIRRELLLTFQEMLLPRKGRFVAFQYTKTQFATFARLFRNEGIYRIWLNLPPAYVWYGRPDRVAE